ncbi:hypothetical protein RHOW815_001449 [Candidatus Rhabdochlamydia sp. W815]|nr:hypothetical protein RHOW815_001449 [Candidatus Rhabdochlamydia sp. W815]
MKNKFMNLRDKVLLRKRAIIETVNDQLKNRPLSKPINIAPDYKCPQLD